MKFPPRVRRGPDVSRVLWNRRSIHFCRNEIGNVSKDSYDARYERHLSSQGAFANSPKQNFFSLRTAAHILEKLLRSQIGVYSPKDLPNSNLSRIDTWSVSYDSKVGHIYSVQTRPIRNVWPDQPAHHESHNIFIE